MEERELKKNSRVSRWSFRRQRGRRRADARGKTPKSLSDVAANSEPLFSIPLRSSLAPTMRVRLLRFKGKKGRFAGENGRFFPAIFFFLIFFCRRSLLFFLAAACPMLQLRRHPHNPPRDRLRGPAFSSNTHQAKQLVQGVKAPRLERQGDHEVPHLLLLFYARVLSSSSAATE